MKVKYNIDEENRKITAIIYDSKSDLLRYVVRKTNIPYKMCKELIKIIRTKNPYLNTDEFIGVAKCAPEDIFNYNYGKTLAARRAQVKYEKNRYKTLKILTDIFYDLTKLLRDSRNRIVVAKNRLSEIDNCVDNFFSGSNVLVYIGEDSQFTIKKNMRSIEQIEEIISKYSDVNNFSYQKVDDKKVAIFYGNPICYYALIKVSE